MGNPRVGKTYFAEFFVNYKALPEYQETAEAQYFSRLINMLDSDLKFNLWVLPGNHKMRPMLPLYFQDVTAVFLAFAVNDIESFLAVEEFERIFD